MNTIGTRASQLRNNDQILMADGLVTITNFKMVLIEDIVTFTATKSDSSVSQRWAAMDTCFDKVVG